VLLHCCRAFKTNAREDHYACDALVHVESPWKFFRFVRAPDSKRSDPDRRRCEGERRQKKAEAQLKNNQRLGPEHSFRREQRDWEFRRDKATITVEKP
jgi:hypothetical protein